MPDFQIPEDLGRLMEAAGFAARDRATDVLELTESGRSMLDSYLGSRLCALGQHDWKTIGRAQMCVRVGCSTQRLSPR